jgi:hypothetical protein
MIRWLRLAALFMVLLVAAALSGCSRGPKTYPVSGQVLLHGKPVAGAAVLLFREKGGRPPEAVTDAKGMFRFTAPAGEYTVVINASEGSPSQSVMDPPPETLPPVRWIIPEKYSRPDTSDLKVTVPSGNELKFEFPRK